METQPLKILRGRPKKGQECRDRITLTLEPLCIKKISKKAKQLGLTRSDFIQSLVNLSTSSNSQPKSVFEKILLPNFLSKLSDLCLTHKIKKLSAFGSIRSELFRENSDVDLLVEFHQDAQVSLFKISRIARELSPLFGQRLIDLRTKEDLSPSFRNDVINNCELLFEDEC